LQLRQVSSKSKTSGKKAGKTAVSTRVITEKAKQSMVKRHYAKSSDDEHHRLFQLLDVEHSLTTSNAPSSKKSCEKQTISV